MKRYNFAAMASVALLLSACGGTEPAAQANASPTVLSMPANRTHTAVLPASSAPMQAVAGPSSVAHIVRTAADEVAAPPSRVLRSSLTDPEIADDVSRAHMALTELDYEKSFSMEKNRQYADDKERIGATFAVE